MDHQKWTRREALVGAGALTFALLPPARSFAAGAAPGAPVARISPVSETFFGETIVDPYRWMEDRSDPEWEPFMKGHAAHTRSVLDAIPGRKALRDRIAELSGATAVAHNVQTAGLRVFYEQRKPGANNFKLYVRPAPGKPERVLLDPTTMEQDGKHVSMDWWSPSPDGSHVAVGLSAAGSEMSVTHVLEVASGRILPRAVSGPTCRSGPKTFR